MHVLTRAVTALLLMFSASAAFASDRQCRDLFRTQTASSNVKGLLLQSKQILLEHINASSENLIREQLATISTEWHRRANSINTSEDSSSASAEKWQSRRLLVREYARAAFETSILTNFYFSSAWIVPAPIPSRRVSHAMKLSESDWKQIESRGFDAFRNEAFVKHQDDARFQYVFNTARKSYLTVLYSGMMWYLIDHIFGISGDPSGFEVPQTLSLAELQATALDEWKQRMSALSDEELTNDDPRLNRTRSLIKDMSRQELWLFIQSQAPLQHENYFQKIVSRSLGVIGFQ